MERNKHDITYTCTFETSLGAVTASAKNEALTGLWFVGQKHFPAKTDAWIDKPDYEVFRLLRVWLSRYFAGTAGIPEPRLDPQGTPFQKSVWRKLMGIPYGKVMTYGDIARNISGESQSSVSARAVGGAVGHNPISILIPCHRVVGAQGKLTGYAGGLERKKALLRIEGVS